MKYAKMLGLLAVAAVALMAFAGVASAALTEATWDSVDVGDTMHSQSGGAITLDGSTSVTCNNSTIEGRFALEQIVQVDALTFTNCGNHTVSVLFRGDISFSSIGGGKATAFASGQEITILTHSLFLGTSHCIYSTFSTHLGTLTGGTTASLSVVSDLIPQSLITPSGPLCAEEIEWTGKYIISTPDTLLVD